MRWRRRLPWPQTIRELESMMVRPAGTTKQRLVWEFMKPTARRVGSLLAITALTLVTWSLVFGAIHGTPWLASGVFGKATLLAVLGVITVVGIFLGFSYVNRALNRLPDPAEEAIRDRAERIAALLGVPNVTMGHTHGADYRRMLGGRSTFVNTGTWIPYHGPWDAAAPRSRQFTFAMIRGDTMHLKRWEDDRNEWVLVPLLEEYRPSTFERLLGENEGEAPKEPRS